MVVVAGADLSFQGTGIVVLDESGQVKASRRIATKSGEPNIFRVARIRDAVLETLQANNVRVVAVEGYAFAKQTAGAHQSGELGGVVRLALIEAGYAVLDIPPTVLKKFVTGRGNAKKEEMSLEVFKRWGVSFRTSDEADAYGLARMARAVLVPGERLTAFQREALEKVDFSLCVGGKDSLLESLLAS